MTKRDEIDYILGLVRQEIDEFLEFDELHGGFISPSEMIVAAIEKAISQKITRPSYNSPIATVDRSYVQFMLDEEHAVPVWSDDDED